MDGAPKSDPVSCSNFILFRFTLALRRGRIMHTLDSAVNGKISGIDFSGVAHHMNWGGSIRGRERRG